MKVSLGWLGEFIDHELDTPVLVDKLTMSGTEVKGVEEIGSEFEAVVVGLIIEILPHPNADRLRLVKIDLGGETPVQVVCGAPNILVGQKIVYAPSGAWLYMSPEATERTQLVPAVIRGVESNGMICSARELGVGNEHKSGVVILDEECRVGESLSTAQGMKDTLIEIEVTPNRGDCLSIYGIARELSALTGKPLKKSLPAESAEVMAWKAQLEGRESALVVQNDNKTACPYYSALVIQDLHVKPAPLWMRWRLLSAGVRPINNLVDITNYVMLELGEPQHAFDRSKLSGDTLVIRNARQDETVVTLDGKTRNLTLGTLVIADSQSAVALAGVMGGESSEISDDTTQVVLEAAHFEPNQVRHVSTGQALRTEGSSRWEKFVDPDLRFWSLRRAAELLFASDSGAQIEALIDDTSADQPARQVVLFQHKIQQLLGQSFTLFQVTGWLRGLGFIISAPASEETEDWFLTVGVPRFRPDIREPADLVEEVLRIAGLDQTGARIPTAEFPLDSTRFALDRRRGCLEILKSLGYTEAFRYSLESDVTLSRLEIPRDTSIRLQNPLTEFESLRFSLLPGLLDTLQKNFQREPMMSVFDLGRVFHRSSDQELPAQPTFVAGLITRPESVTSPVWSANESALALIKSHVQSLLDGLGIEDYMLTMRLPNSEIKNLLHPGRSATLQLAGQELGWFAELDPSFLMRIGMLGLRCASFELNLTTLLALPREHKQYEPFSAYPPIVADLSLFVPPGTIVAALRETIWQLNLPFLTQVEVVDVFQSEELAKRGQQALTLRMTFQAENHTLEDSEISPLIVRIQETMGKAHAAKLRTVESKE